MNVSRDRSSGPPFRKSRAFRHLRSPAAPAHRKIHAIEGRPDRRLAELNFNPLYFRIFQTDFPAFKRDRCSARPPAHPGLSALSTEPQSRSFLTRRDAQARACSDFKEVSDSIHSVRFNTPSPPQLGRSVIRVLSCPFAVKKSVPAGRFTQSRTCRKRPCKPSGLHTSPSE